jgi:hypothetical protein
VQILVVLATIEMEKVSMGTLSQNILGNHYDNSQKCYLGRALPSFLSLLNPNLPQGGSLFVWFFHFLKIFLTCIQLKMTS